MNYPFELTTRTADLTTSKSCEISQFDPKYKMDSFRFKNFYSATPLDDPEYTRIVAILISQECIDLLDW